MCVSGRRSGFSLIEAAVAVAVLALGCLSAAGALHAVFRAEAAGGQRREAGSLLDAEASRLAALPFHLQASGPGEGPPSLLGEVFPHARVELNRGPEGFSDTSGAAVFVSAVTVEGCEIRRTATLVRDDDSSTVPLPAGEVSGWAVWEDVRPPALAVDVLLELRGRPGHAVERRVVLRALRAHAGVALVGLARPQREPWPACELRPARTPASAGDDDEGGLS